MEQIKLTRRSFVAGTAAAGAMAALGLAGCGSSSTSTSGSSGTSETTTTTTTEETGGGTITAACSYQTTSFNPVGASSALALPSIWHCLEGLYDLDIRTNETYTALAADDPTKISDTEYEITLRDGAKFSDGTAVTAEDVVNAIQLNCDNDVYRDMLAFIASAEAKDDTTITLKLNYPFESLLKDRLSLCKVFPASATEDELTKGALGSGPWMYTSVNGTDGGEIDFEPNPNYNGSKPAEASEMKWSVITDGTARTTALQEATVMVGENIPDANVEQLTSAGATVDYVAGFGLAFLMFNCQKAPFNDARVRQAFFYAIDIDKLIANQMNGNAHACKSYLPEDHANFHEASTVFTYDPDKARSLLAEAGAEGLTFTLRVNQNWVVALAPQLKEDFDAVGMNCTIEENAQPYQDLGEQDGELPYDVMLAPGDPSCFGSDPDLLMTWYYGDNIWTHGRSVWSKAGDGKFEEFQTLLQTGREATGNAQQEAWNQCLDMLSEQVPLYPLFHRDIATGYWDDKIEGFVPYGTTGLVFLDCNTK